MNCILCQTPNDPIDESIYACSNCKCNYSSHTKQANYDNYEQLYPGMKEWCEELKNKPNFWRRVADRGVPYRRVMGWFMNYNENLNVLDVGCGFGYVVYILRKLGFTATGMDISKEAIDFANKTFESKYEVGSVYDWKEKHDLILAIEVFEHVENPFKWLKRCLEIAPNVMITTPNLDYYKEPWPSDQPPVHLIVFRKETLEWLAKELGAEIEWIDDKSANLVAIFRRES